MSISKHRKTIAVLFAAVSFAGAGPIVSAANADTKGGGGTTDVDICGALQNNYQQDLDYATQAYIHGYTNAGNIFSEQAKDDKLNAQDLGCSWATRVSPPTKPTSVRPVTTAPTNAVK